MILANGRLPIVVAAVLLLGACANAESTDQSDPVVQEMNELSVPAGATPWAPCKYSARSASQRLYSCLYNANLSFAELLAAYNKELLANGWRKAETEKLRDWGRDLGGEDVTFCKGNVQLNLQFAGKRAQYGWQYAIATSVGVPPYICSG